MVIGVKLCRPCQLDFPSVQVQLLHQIIVQYRPTHALLGNCSVKVMPIL
jgi:hypothetical protein